MKITLLRNLDYWMGRPICWLITVLYKIKKLFVDKGPIENPRRILFIKLFGMGSIILALPSLEAVRDRYKDADLYFLTFAENREVLNMSGIVPDAHIVTIRTGSIWLLALDIIRGYSYLLGRRLDVVIDMEFFSRFTAILSFFVRARHRIGFYGFHAEGLKRGSFIDFQINYNHTLHTSRAFYTLLRPLGIYQNSNDLALPEVLPGEDRSESIIQLLKDEGKDLLDLNQKRLIAINPNSSSLISLRNWPMEHFKVLTEMLLEEDEEHVIVFAGSPGERTSVEDLRRSLKKEDTARTINMAGRTSIRGLYDLLKVVDYFISNDSGPAHMAALAKTPGLVLFGPETPGLYAPMFEGLKCIYLGLDCQPCVTVFNGKNSYCNDNVCLQRIEPEFVKEFVMDNMPPMPAKPDEPPRSDRIIS